MICDCDGEYGPNSPPEEAYLVDLLLSQMRSLRTSGFLCTQSEKGIAHNLELFLLTATIFFTQIGQNVSAHNLCTKYKVDRCLARYSPRA